MDVDVDVRVEDDELLLGVTRLIRREMAAWRGGDDEVTAPSPSARSRL